MKSGSLNLPEPSGPAQACNGVALPLPLYKHSTKYSYCYQKRTKRLHWCGQKMHKQFCEETSWEMHTDKENSEVHLGDRGMGMESELIPLCTVSSGRLQYKQP